MSNRLPRDISDTQLDLWIKGIRGTIWYLLESIRYLLEDLANNQSHKMNTQLTVTGLYTHALEEYGKLVLLNSIEPVGGRIVLDSIRNELRDHNVKMQLALEDLPAECGRVVKGAFDSGAFSSASFQTHNSLDWNTRLDIFNTDIDEFGNVHPTPRIDLNGLEEAIKEFHTGQFMR
jgi:hypothetical protein